MPVLRTADADLYYETHGPPPGEAPAIVFAHGAGGNSLSWWQQVPHFARRRTCVTFDHRGFGRSLEAPPGRGGAAFVDDLEALVDHLRLARVALVAQSMGGWTCLGFALRAPQRVTHLVMADTHGGLASPAIAAAWAPAFELAAALPPDVHPAAGRRMRDEQPALHFLYKCIDALNPPRGLPELAAILVAAGAPTPEEVGRLGVPVLFIAGEEDIVVPPRVLELAAACLPRARLVRVPAAGHSVYFERAAVFNALVEEFLTAAP